MMTSTRKNLYYYIVKENNKLSMALKQLALIQNIRPLLLLHFSRATSFGGLLASLYAASFYNYFLIHTLIHFASYGDKRG